MTLRIKSLQPFGVEILGLDLERPLEESARAEIRALWARHGLVLVRGGGTSPEAHLRFSECFGRLQPSAMAKINADENPFLMSLVADPRNQRRDTISVYEVNGEPRAGYIRWHWDQAFMPEIIRGAVLRMIEPARAGGETGWINAADAYDRLPADLRGRIDGLEVVYHFNSRMEANRFGGPKDLRLIERTPEGEVSADRYLDQFPAVVHPMVITQPETGRKILKLSPLHARCILGLTQAESHELLEEIADSLTDERYAYVHRWEADDLAAWDNWLVIHAAYGVPPGVSRRAQRTTIVGDYHLGRYLDPEVDPVLQTARFVD